MAVIFEPVENNLKKIHYFRKQHLNYYKQETISNSSSTRFVLNEYYNNDMAENFEADGIHFFNITADATLKDSNDTYTFYSCKVSTSGRQLYVEFPEELSGTLFIRVSFDVYFYTIEENE